MPSVLNPIVMHAVNSVHSFVLFPRAPRFLPQSIAGSGYETDHLTCLSGTDYMTFGTDYMTFGTACMTFGSAYMTFGALNMCHTNTQLMTHSIPQYEPYEHALFMVSGSMLRHMYRLGLTIFIMYQFKLTVKNSRRMSSTQF